MINFLLKSNLLLTLLGSVISAPGISHVRRSFSDTYIPPENMKLISSTDQAIAPGIFERQIVLNDLDNKNQKVGWAVEVDMSDPSIEIKAGYADYDPTVYKMQTTSLQAKALEKATGKNVVASFNSTIFNMSTGEPLGPFTLNGKSYSGYDKSNGIDYPFFGVKNDGSTVFGFNELYRQLTDNNDLKEAIAGFYPLVKNGEIVEGLNSSLRNPRTAIGKKADGKLVFYVVDGRNYPYSNGTFDVETARILKSLGCVDAISFDGGGSTTYLAKLEGTDKLQLRNIPSDGSERQVSGTIHVISNSKKSGEFDHASVTPNNKIYTPGSSVQFSALGVDNAGGKAELPTNLTWKMDDDSFGTITTNSGLFTSSGKIGEAKINLFQENKIVGSSFVLIEKPDKIQFKEREISLGFEKTSDLGLQAFYKDREVITKDGDYAFVLSDERMGQFNGNIFTSSSGESLTGSITVTYKLDEELYLTDTLTAVIGKMPVVVFDFENSQDIADSWVAQTTGRGEVGSFEVVNYDSGEPVRFGNSSLKVNFDFTNAQKNTTLGVYAGYQKMDENNVAQAYKIPGKPTAIGMWVYGTPESQGYWLRMYVGDSSGRNQPLNFSDEPYKVGKGIDWLGWKYCEASLENITAPYYFWPGQIIRIMYLKSGVGDGNVLYGEMTKGSLYFDDLRFVYGANLDDLHSPVINSVKVNDTEVNGQNITTNLVNLSATYEDYQDDKYKTGMDYDKINFFVDGINYRNVAGIYSNDTTNNKVMLNEVYLTNGDHELKVVVRDKFGNETTEKRYLTVNGDDSTRVMIIPTVEDSHPKLGNDYKLDIKTNNIKDIKKINTTLEFNNLYTEFNVEFKNGFTGTYNYNPILKTLNIEANNIENNQATDNVIATISVPIPSDLSENSKFACSLVYGEMSLNNTAALPNNFLMGFGNKPISENVQSSYVIEYLNPYVGQDLIIEVKTTSGELASGVEIINADNLVSLGVTDENGRLTIQGLSSVAAKVSLYGSKGNDYSFISRQFIVNVAGINGTIDKNEPYNIISTTVKDSSSMKSVSWMNNPILSSNKAYIEYALKDEYEKLKEAAFIRKQGVSKNMIFDGANRPESNFVCNINTVLLENLKSSKDYVYRVGDGEVFSEIKSFTTRRNGQDTNFFIMGDVQAKTMDKLQAAFDDIVAKNIDYSFGIQTGDFIDSAKVYSYWDEALKVVSGVTLQNFDMLNVIGNHEQMGDGVGMFAQSIYNLPNSKHYSVKYGNVYVATISYTTTESALIEELEWLVEDAKKSNARWKVLTMHQPPYYTNITGSNELNNKYVPAAAQKAGIDFVFSGHDHAYARTKPMTDGVVDEKNGIVYFVCGSLGEKSYEATNTEAFNFAKLDGEYDSIYLSISATNETFTVNTIETGIDSPIDTYTKTKEACTEHNYIFDIDEHTLYCSICDQALDITSYTGFARDINDNLFFIKEGLVTTGLYETYEGGDIYYFDDNGYGYNGTVKVNGVDRIFTNGVLTGGFTGIYKASGGKQYYIDGVVQRGQWLALPNDEYMYFKNNTYAMTGKDNIGIKPYEFDSNGILIKGYYDKYNKLYYWGPFEEGKSSSGWYYYDKAFHYFDPNNGNKLMDGKQTLDGGSAYFVNGELKYSDSLLIVYNCYKAIYKDYKQSFDEFVKSYDNKTLDQSKLNAINLTIGNVQTINILSQIKLPTKEGYTVKYYYNSDTKNEIKLTQLFGFGDFVVLPVYTPISYKVTFDANGGEVNDQEITIKFDDQYKLPTPTRTGYTFKGWYNDEQLIEDGTWYLLSNLYIKAHWEAKNYIINLDAKGGEIDKNTIEVTYDSPFNLPTIERNGYNFIGWFDGENILNSGTWNYTENKSLMAKYQLSQETLSKLADYKNSLNNINNNSYDIIKQYADYISKFDSDLVEEYVTNIKAKIAEYNKLINDQNSEISQEFNKLDGVMKLVLLASSTISLIGLCLFLNKRGIC